MSKPLSKPVSVTSALPDISAVVKANSKKTEVVRTSIPASVRNALNIQAGDKLVWELSHDGVKVFVKVTKGEKKE